MGVSVQVLWVFSNPWASISGSLERSFNSGTVSDHVSPDQE
jgi:hypothetical protein